MNILIVGTGYAGLVTGACFADLGVNVTCVDSDARKINLLLYGGLPVYEQGLEDMVKRSVAAQRLNFTSNFSNTSTTMLSLSSSRRFHWARLRKSRSSSRAFSTSARWTSTSTWFLTPTS